MQKLPINYKKIRDIDAMVTILSYALMQTDTFGQRLRTTSS
jgi:hypothetical protein